VSSSDRSGRRATERAAEQVFEAFNRRDIDAMLALVDPEIVFAPVSARLIGDGSDYRGHDGLRRYLRDVATHWRHLEVTPAHVRSAGDAVVALGHVRSTTHAGRRDEASATWVFKFRAGLVTQILVFSDERLARQAVNDVNRA
jgi:ketosteroid isomerase-like protein